MDNLIIKQFKDYIDNYNNANNYISKLVVKREMQAFIIALELSGKNLDAGKCKELYEGLDKN